MSILTKLQCQSCSAALAQADDFKNTIQCKYCGSTYQLNQSENSDSPAELIPQTQLRAVKPDDIEINRSGNTIEFKRNWRKKGSFILLSMAIIWVGVSINELAQTWLDGADASILFLLIFLTIGVLLFYRALSEIFNKSTLTVNKKLIRLKTRPFAWKGDFSQPSYKIKYFEILPPPGPSISTSVKSYRICAITDDDMRLTLLNAIRQQGHAIYLFREINLLLQKQ